MESEIKENAIVPQKEDFLIRRMKEKYDIKFNMLSQLFDACLKGKTKSKTRLENINY